MKNLTVGNLPLFAVEFKQKKEGRKIGETPWDFLFEIHVFSIKNLSRIRLCTVVISKIRARESTQ